MHEDALKRLASEDDDAVPIRMVEAATYCPRQAWYRFVAQDDPINVHMQRGLDRHETFGEQPTKGGVSEDEDDASSVRVWRHLPVRAPILGVMGVLDEVMVTPEQLTITEYKTTRLKKIVYEGLLMQLCVQHLALREHAGSSAWHGTPLPERTVLRVYYTDSRRSQEVEWNDALAYRAEEVVKHCREILQASLPPPGLVGPRCADCQHEPICLPFDLPKLKEAVL